MDQFEFKCDKLSDYMRKISERSVTLLADIISEYSPIQVGEDVDTSYWDEHTTLRVTEIKVRAISSWGYPGERLSFSYMGMPLTKSGNVMKNRKPKWFDTFHKDGKSYHMPSYNRVEIDAARMFSRGRS